MHFPATTTHTHSAHRIAPESCSTTHRTTFQQHNISRVSGLWKQEVRGDLSQVRRTAAEWAPRRCALLSAEKSQIWRSHPSSQNPREFSSHPLSRPGPGSTHCPVCGLQAGRSHSISSMHCNKTKTQCIGNITCVAYMMLNDAGHSHLP